MPNLLNEAIHAEYEGVLTEDLDALVVQPVGMTVQNVNDLRAKLRASGLEMRVVKNSLAARILAQRGFDGTDAILAGPSAIVLASDDDIDGAAIMAAKVVAKWRKENGGDAPAIKGGIMERKVLGEADAAALEKMPGKAELQSMLVAQILAPGRKLAAQLTSAGGKLASQIKTHIENQEKAG